MNQFKILDRNFSIHRNYLVEASAGTGKTFSIQNIVVRLLIETAFEDTPLSLADLLIVTFTRAAARELKMRIRKNIEAVHDGLNHWLQFREISKNLPDYVLKILENEDDLISKTKKRLKQALFAFDQAQIFTIHSFCARMLKHFVLESDLGLKSGGGEEATPNSELMAVMRDFFRTEIRYDNYSPYQLEKFLSMDKNQKKLMGHMHNHYEIIDLPDFKELYDRFCLIMLQLKQSLGLSAAELMEDFKTQVIYYKNYNKDSKAVILEKIRFFSSLFDQDNWSKDDFDRLIKDDLVWIHSLEHTLLKKALPASLQLHYADLWQIFQKNLYPIIQVAGDPACLFARLTKDFKTFLANFKGEEEKFSPDDFLIKMQKSLNHNHFLEYIQNKYQAVIIDEFQDTDPLQWDIFQRLFVPSDQSWKGYLYLVGDPKQSIYSFRQADIYTYLAALKALGKEKCFSLDVNYRSHPTLIEALNTLFLPANSPDLFPLPKENSELFYQSVISNEMVSPLQEDGRGAVHFMLGDASGFPRIKVGDLEQSTFFPYISQEILRLRQQSGLDFSQFAILVRDRHQAIRLADYFARFQIPYINQKQRSLIDSVALTSFIDVLRGILYPKDRSAVKTALGSRLLGWDYEQIKKFDHNESVLLTIYRLRKTLIEKGFAIFFYILLDSHWCQGELSLKNSLLNQEGGVDVLHDLQQIADLIIQHQHLEWNSPEGIIPFLDHLQDWDEQDKRLKRIQDPSQEGVKILTLHYSKGLEFDIVFALGLMNRRKLQEYLIPVEIENRTLLIPSSQDAEALHRFCEENDAEKMRQLYVSLTRAKFRVYIPLIKNFPGDHIKIGEASPLDLFLARFNQPRGDYIEIYERIRGNPESSLLQFIEEQGKKHFLSCSNYLDLDLNQPKQVETTSTLCLIKPKPIVLHHPALQITSFSGLNRENSHQAVKNTHELIPHDYYRIDKTVHTLPANADTGIFIHSLLEKINFNHFKQYQNEKEAFSLIEPLVQHTVYKEWGHAIASMLFHGLKTKLRGQDDFLCLAELKPAEFYREMPFLYPLDEDVNIEELGYVQGLIKGVIDLIFINRNRYFIVDWKTNWLGIGLEDYSPEKIALSITDHAYHLQAKIYQEALRRYLQIVDPRPFEECYGGTFYLYLRGMSVGKLSGIFAH